MRVRLDRYEAARKSIGLRSMLLLVFGGVGAIVGGFLVILGLLILVMEEGDLWSARAGIVVGFIGLVPTLLSALAIWRGVAGRIRLKQLADLAAFARHSPEVRPSELARGMNLTAQQAERLLFDATRLGILEEGPPGASSYPAPAPVGAPFATIDGGAAPAGPIAITPAPAGARAGAGDVLGRTVAAPGSSAPPPAAWIGAVLNGTYRIEGPLGSGGMGAVFAARQLRTGRRYAIKTLLPDARLSPDAIRRFEREATAASALGHPGIVAVHDFNETAEGVHYLVMDLLEGDTLEQRLGRVGTLAWPDARRVALEIGAALAAAHDHGLIHRDLKPANILLARAPSLPERAVLLDFGLAKPIDDAMISRITVTGAAVGTPMYMSPEQARGDAVDVRTDVYGLGAVVYEMVTGAPPFLDRTLATVYARLLTEAPPSASSVAPSPLPPGLDEVLARALAKTPAERFPDVRSLCDALGRVGTMALVG